MNTWSLTMAWRDSRGSRQRLLLYLSSMVLGVAALVAIQGFGDNLTRTIDQEARTLLGADYSLEKDNQPFSDSTEAIIDSLGGETSRRLSFNTNAIFPDGGTRLTTVRAIEGNYPFYGEVVTRPDSAAQTYLQGGRQALVDGTLVSQFNLQVGDTVRIGRYGYRVAGELQKMPRESAIVSSISPRIYIPRSEVDSTLLVEGSRAEYEVYFKFEEGRDVQAIEEELTPYLERNDVGSDTVEEAASNWREGLGNLYRFLSLVGFAALLLGSLGVASTVNVYVRRRLESIAVLRCLGASAARTFQIYLVQAGVLGLLGAVAGSAVGVGIQALVPQLLKDFLPVEVSFFVSWPAVFMGLGIGVGVTLLFALWPLLTVRDVTPLRALRSDVEPTEGQWTDPWRWGVVLAIIAAVTGFGIMQAPETVIGLYYAAGILGVFLALSGVAWLITWAVRRFFPTSWPYAWRQGLANLYRPNNQTTVMMLALGLGTFLIMTLLLVQDTLLEEIRVSTSEGQPNLVLFDVQPQQLDGVAETVRSEGLPVLERVPIVTTRLKSVKGRTVREIERDSTTEATWAHEREYRVTYRSELSESETLLDGQLADSIEGNPLRSGQAVPISIEQEIAREELGVALGDTLVFDVQGVPVTTYVASIRQVDWQRVGTNFFVVFPPGVLEQAPQIYVVLSRAADQAASASVQQKVVQQYPNVSTIDLSLVLSTFQDLYGKMQYVVQSMALFSIITGLIVLIGAVVVSRVQRIEESVLLKTLGASRSTVQRITAIEYLFLGVFASLTGIVLAVGAAWALSFFVFEGPFVVPGWTLFAAVGVVTGLTVAVGLLNSRGVYERPPLDVLRAEA